MTILLRAMIADQMLTFNFYLPYRIRNWITAISVWLAKIIGVTGAVIVGIIACTTAQLALTIAAFENLQVFGITFIYVIKYIKKRVIMDIFYRRMNWGSSEWTDLTFHDLNRIFWRNEKESSEHAFERALRTTFKMMLVLTLVLLLYWYLRGWIAVRAWKRRIQDAEIAWIRCSALRKWASAVDGRFLRRQLVFKTDLLFEDEMNVQWYNYWLVPIWPNRKRYGMLYHTHC